jgi:hypothetical protein
MRTGAVRGGIMGLPSTLQDSCRVSELPSVPMGVENARPGKKAVPLALSCCRAARGEEALGAPLAAAAAAPAAAGEVWETTSVVKPLSTLRVTGPAGRKGEVRMQARAPSPSPRDAQSLRLPVAAQARGSQKLSWAEVAVAALGAAAAAGVVVVVAVVVGAAPLPMGVL